jgi:enamine deaminase RidA (YjgF/YER057c/UK114 family)
VERREKHFNRPYPADTIVEVKSLALPDLMIEIEAVALAEGEVGD